MRILVVDDEPISRDGASFFLRNAMRLDVTEASDGAEALAHFEENPFPLVLSDIRMPNLGGLQLLHRLRELPGGENCRVILMTGFADVDSAVTALRQGAFDYLYKPLETDTLATVVRNAMEAVEMEQSTPPSASSDATEPPTSSRTISIPGYGNIGVFSDAMRDAVRLALHFHEDPTVPVLIQGETGTGKEAIARLVHGGLKETDTPFVSVNCSAIAPSLFESDLFGYEEGAFTGARSGGRPGRLEAAEGGVLFLDEIGDMPLELQPKLLRVLQEKEFERVGSHTTRRAHVRFVAATNQPLEERLRNGGFRQDLFYRLNTGLIRLAPLRERTADIIPLARMFLIRFATEKRKGFRVISPDAAALLQRYPWPGNVRELQNTIERAVLLHDGETITVHHLSFLPGARAGTTDVRAVTSLSPEQFELPEGGLDLEAFNRMIVRRTLEKFDGNKTHAARYLGLTRSAFRRRVDQLGDDVSNA